MIELLALFLGLTTGVQPVEVLATPEVARVEVRLDGTAVARLDAARLDAGAPAEVDFGDELMPHHLELVAFDAAGGVLGRSCHDVNLAPGGDLSQRTPVVLPASRAGAGLRVAGRPVDALAVDGGDGGDLVAVVTPGAARCLAPFEEPVLGPDVADAARRSQP